MYSKEDLIDFLKNCTPKIEKIDEEYKMFTIVTQWVGGETLEQLLEYGVEQYKKYGNVSPLARLFNSLEESLEEL